MRLLTVLCALLVSSSAVQAAELAEILGSPYNSASLDNLTLSPETYNQVTLLHLGKNSKPMRLKLLAEAEHFLFITVPYWFDDKEGNLFLEAAKKKKAEMRARGRNLDLRVLVDWTSPGSSDDLLGLGMYSSVKELTEGHTVQWNKLWNFRSWSSDILKRRIHDKIFVVDGKKFIMGGMNIADDYLEGGTTSKGWHDTDILVEGPAAQQAEKLFLKPYLLQHYLDNPLNPFPADPQMQIKVLNELFYQDNAHAWFRSDLPWKLRQSIDLPLDSFLKNPHYFPKLPPNPLATTPLRLIYDNPWVDRRPVTGKHFSKLLNTLQFILPQAKHSLKLFIPYLTTTNAMNQTLIAAAKHLKVQVITNSLKSHDLGDLNYKAALMNFAVLVKAGVEIYEWQGHEDLIEFQAAYRCPITDYWPGRTLHTKAAIIDDQVTLLGSHNMNVRSERLNSELMALIRDPKFSRQMADVFAYDLDLVTDEPGGIRNLVCGNQTYSNQRPRRTNQVRKETLEWYFRHQGMLIQFLNLFQPVM